MLLTLPTEIVLQILLYLTTVDIVSSRQACTQLAKLTRDKSIWANLVDVQRRRSIPLPRSACFNDSGWDAEALETLVISNEIVDALWLLPRQSAPVHLSREHGDRLIRLEIFLDRWILGVYTDGFVNLWDIHQIGGPKGFVNTGDEKTVSYQSALDDSGEKLLILVIKAQRPGLCIAHLYQIPLSQSPVQFMLIRTFPTSSSRLSRRIHPQKRLVAFSQLSSVDLVRWSDEENQDRDIFRMFIPSTQVEDFDEMFSSILSLQILDEYILVVKTRSIEIHPIPIPLATSEFTSTSNPSLPVLRHTFPNYNFRDVELSDVEIQEDVDDDRQRNKQYSVKMLASDVIQGLFYFVVGVSIHWDMTSQTPLLDVRLDVRLAGIYAMADRIPLQSISELRGSSQTHTHLPFYNSAPPPNQTSLNHLLSPPDTTDSPTNSDAARIRSSSFVSTYALGAQGLRAVWVERRRGSTAREVVACRILLSETEDDINTKIPPKALEYQRICSIQPHDLRDDITFCALGEASGIIVLGNRVGGVFILEPGT